jgi:hypothetical protein
MENFIGYNQFKTKKKVSTLKFDQIKIGIYSIAKDSVYFVNFSSLSHIQDKPE